jgi:type IV secretion system protein VirD4
MDPEDSHKYNPLTFAREQPDYIWEDSRLLAELMIVP